MLVVSCQLLVGQKSLRVKTDVLPMPVERTRMSVLLKSCLFFSN
ncbi:MAG: hypothetical protein SXA11_02105 [Cyanobacteriota bacterium]|nr:hypothetical protein [Cyanobacteriota bacterium]